MHHNGLLHHHAGLVPASDHIVSNHNHAIMPREAFPYPYPVADPQPAEGLRDFGEFLDPDFKDSSYFHGLTGVDQYLNYLLANVMIATFFMLLLFVLIY